MSKLEKIMKLANEAVELIKEFREEAAILGCNPLKSVTIQEDGEIIEVDDEFEGVKEYFLTDISSVFTVEMRGWGPCSSGFYEEIELRLSELEYDFKKYSKEEFKELTKRMKVCKKCPKHLFQKQAHYQGIGSF